MKKESPIRTIVIDSNDMDDKSKRTFNRSCVDDSITKQNITFSDNRDTTQRL